MNAAQTNITLGQRFDSLNLNWDFWVTFAWIETRSIDVLETVHAYRASPALLRNAAHNVPVIIAEVCGYECCCGKNSTCPLWNRTRRTLAKVCSDGNLRAFGLPSGSTRPQEIPAEDWLLDESVDEPASLQIGDTYWSRLLFPAAAILELYPPRKRPERAGVPSPASLERYVGSKVKVGWNRRQICEDAKTHFLPNLPTRKSVENAYKMLIPNAPRGRPPKPKP